MVVENLCNKNKISSELAQISVINLVGSLRE
jgi:hypothetical protein